jgi:DNA-binding winged helix-turn-helix (wHTH) protein/TolB-like protein
MPGADRVRFGIFDFDPAAGELRREGVLVRLQAQPAQVLALLVASAGEVVTRETLRQAVWGAETFVDFDRGLNFCVAQIRSALGDSADSPRFIRTVPKRGYQFIAPVAAEVKAPPARRPRREFAVATAVLLTCAAGVLFFAWSRNQPPAVRIAVTRFDNQTGNPDLDRFADGLTDAVVADLTAAGAGRYGVIGNAAILRAPREKRDLVAIGRSLKTGYVVLGQVQRNESSIRLLAHLIRLPEQTHVRVTRWEGPAGDPLKMQADFAKQVAADFSKKL